MATWLVLHKTQSQYGDIIGKTYEYPIGIPNSNQIRSGDFLVFCLTKKSAKNDKRILGFGKIHRLESKPPLNTDEKQRKRLAAHLVDYKEFNPALSFDDIGGDPRSNKTNSISRINVNLDIFPVKESNHIPNDDFITKQQYARNIRRRQLKFRESLLKVYDSNCCVSGHGPEIVLEACHIIPHSESGINQLENGLLLRSDLHHLFDEGLLRINPETLCVELNPILLETPYSKYDGQELRARNDGKNPNKEYLKRRYTNH
ncbi:MULTISPECIES: HNH endonuclease [Flavobacteriaceae]|uniref:HNH endonuclease n=1 Tax=Flavobacteriaceae TaxID=49546 RepID=UPI0014914C08|nr:MULTISPECIES: HNH endonuclease signature motif containing protein [Allomuricauda]MDC6365084.1 HNH endonuclease signature motif containing protein [Muricauda sp. AC10]